MRRFYLVTLPQSFASGVLGAKDLLTAGARLLAHGDAGDAGGRLPFATELVGATRRVETTFGPPLDMDRVLAETGPADVVYISPLAFMPENEPRYDPALLKWLRAQHAAGAVVCAACTGTLPLAASGLLDGLPATTHWAYTELFRRNHPTVDLDPRRTLIAGGTDYRLVTAGAHASWYDLMLYLIHRFSGAATARRLARLFLLDWHELDQNAYASFRDERQHGDAAVQEAQQWFRANLSHPEPVEAAIAASGLSARSFHRRFRQATGHTPIQYVQRVRVEHAKDRLESADESVEAVAWRVGYEDVAHFRRLFRRLTGLAPGQYRKAFRTPPNIAEQLPAG